MQVAGQRIIQSEPGQTWRLHVIGDVHLGNRGCAVDRFRERVAQVFGDPFAIWIGVGDYADAIDYRDPRFDAEQLPKGTEARDLMSWGKVMREQAAAILAPIGPKCIGLGYGNHEDHFMAARASRDWWDDFRRDIGNPTDLGYCAFLDLVFRVQGVDHSYRIATHHGAGWAQTPGGKLNRLRSFLDAFAADIVLTGHTHERLDHQVVTLAADPTCTHLAEVPRVGVVCGTWLRTYTEGPAGYGEKRGYRPVPLGNPAVTIQPETRRLGVEW